MPHVPPRSAAWRNSGTACAACPARRLASASPQIWRAWTALSAAAGAAIVMVVSAVFLPAALLAVRTYVVVLPGRTVNGPCAGTLPISGSIVSVLAPEASQFRVAEAPAAIDSGSAENRAMTGSEAGALPGAVGGGLAGKLGGAPDRNWVF